MNDDPNLILSEEEEKAADEVIIGYARQTRRDGCGSVESFSMECLYGDSVKAGYQSYQDGAGVVNEHFMANAPPGILHYGRNSRPWVLPNCKMAYLPDDNFVGYGIIHKPPLGPKEDV